MKVLFLLVAAVGVSNALRMSQEEAVVDKPPAVFSMYHMKPSDPNRPGLTGSDYPKMVKCWLDKFLQHESFDLLQVTTFDEGAAQFIDDYKPAQPSWSKRIRRTDSPFAKGDKKSLHRLQANQTSEAAFSSQEYMKAMFPVTEALLREGRDTLHSDLDAIWLRDPMPELQKLKDAQPDWDVISSTMGCAPGGVNQTSWSRKSLHRVEQNVEAQDGQGYFADAFGINIGFVMFRANQKNIDKMELLGKTAKGRPYEAWDQRAIEYEYKKNCKWFDIHGEKEFPNLAETCQDDMLPAEGIMAICAGNTKILFLGKEKIYRPRQTDELTKPQMNMEDPNILVAHPTLSWQQAKHKNDPNYASNYKLLNFKAPNICKGSE